MMLRSLEKEPSGSKEGCVLDAKWRWMSME